MDLRNIAEELQPKSMAARDWVFQVIRTAIVRGILPGDMPLRQDEISSALNVSHIPVREAFRQLEAQGLVRIYPNRGAVVTKLTRNELECVMNTRIILEQGMLKASLKNMTERHLQNAEEALREFDAETVSERCDVINLRFHSALYEAANNPYALSLIDQMHANIDRYVHPYYQISHQIKMIKSIDEHRALLIACRARDLDLALSVLTKHLESTKVLLMDSPML